MAVPLKAGRAARGRSARTAGVAASLLVLLAASAPRADDARTQMARAGEALKASRFDEAVEAYTRAESLASGPAGRANAANGAGFVFLKLRRYGEAIPCFARAVAAAPRHKVAWNNLGICYLRRFESGVSGTGELDSARAAFTAVAGLDPAFHPEHLRTVRDLLAQEAACSPPAWSATVAGTAPVPSSTTAVPGSPGGEALPPPAPAGTFVSYRAAGDRAEDACAWELARANYERAEAVATTKRSRSAAANLLGLLALRTRSPQAAVDALRRATLADPASKFAWNNLGVALMRLYDAGTGGKELIEQAVDAFGHVAAIDASYKPDNLAWSRAVLTELGGPTVSATTGLDSGTVLRDSTP